MAEMTSNVRPVGGAATAASARVEYDPWSVSTPGEGTPPSMPPSNGPSTFLSSFSWRTCIKGFGKTWATCMVICGSSRFFHWLKAKLKGEGDEFTWDDFKEWAWGAFKQSSLAGLLGVAVESGMEMAAAFWPAWSGVLTTTNVCMFALGVALKVLYIAWEVAECFDLWRSHDADAMWLDKHLMCGITHEPLTQETRIVANGQTYRQSALHDFNEERLVLINSRTIERLSVLQGTGAQNAHVWHNLASTATSPLPSSEWMEEVGETLGQHPDPDLQKLYDEFCVPRCPLEAPMGDSHRNILVEKLAARHLSGRSLARLVSGPIHVRLGAGEPQSTWDPLYSFVHCPATKAYMTHPWVDKNGVTFQRDVNSAAPPPGEHNEWACPNRTIQQIVYRLQGKAD
jgi:hypothetical protein